MNSMFPSNVPRIAEAEVKLESKLGQGAFSTVWRATWNRASSVGRGGVVSQVVAVKIPKSHVEHVTADVARELVVLATLPHQNLLYLYGICESSPPKMVVECMSEDLSCVLRSGKLRSRYQKLRVLRDISAGLAHLHFHGVIHRDVKPSNVLLRDDQTKLCDLGSSKDVLQTVQHMTTVGTIAYMAPEVRDGRPAGKAVDVWSFGVLMFEVLMGHLPQLNPVAQMRQAGCLAELCVLFEQCNAVDAAARPTMVQIHGKLLALLMNEVQDQENLRAEIRVAQAQDLETYNVVWRDHYGNQAGMDVLLAQVKALAHKHSSSSAVHQPLAANSLECLAALAQQAAGRLHQVMRRVVEEHNGKYLQALTKSNHRVVQKVREEYGGKFNRLLDLERATGLFNLATDVGDCLSALSAEAEVEVARCKDRLNVGLASGYRDVLLNVRDRDSGFVCELQLNFHKIAEIKSQTHRFYEMLRVMKNQA
jgi:serine/threonine-protein kinase